MMNAPPIRTLLLDEEVDAALCIRMADLLREACNCEVRIALNPPSPDLHLDLQPAIPIVGVIFGIATFLLKVWEISDSRQWTVEDVEKAVRRAAIDLTGKWDCKLVGVVGLNDFLENDCQWCKVNVLVAGEDIIFYVHRDGDVLSITQED